MIYLPHYNFFPLESKLYEGKEFGWFTHFQGNEYLLNELKK